MLCYGQSGQRVGLSEGVILGFWNCEWKKTNLLLGDFVFIYHYKKSIVNQSIGLIASMDTILVKQVFDRGRHKNKTTNCKSMNEYCILSLRIPCFYECYMFEEILTR